MTIEVYPSKMPGRPIEVHAVGGMTIGQWFDSEQLAWRGREHQPVEVEFCGVRVPPSQWDDTRFAPNEVVRIYLRPHGGAFKAIGGIISKVFNLVFGWMMPNVASADSSSTMSGAEIEASSATANTAKLNGTVPEHFGRYKRYPDYLTPPRRYFQDRRDQYLTFLTCVGVGRFEIEAGSVKIGDTPLDGLDGVEYTIYEPGADVTGNWAHDHWYSVDEVGSTSSGTAGLELSSDIATEVDPTVPSYSLNGSQLVAQSGEFPSSWTAGTTFDMLVPRTYTITVDAESDPARTIVTGNFRHVMDASALGGTLHFMSNDDDDETSQVFDSSLDANGDGSLTISYKNVWPAGTRTLRVFVLNRRYRVTSTPSSTTVNFQAVNSSGSVVSGWQGFAPYTGALDITAEGGTTYGPFAGPFRVCPNNERVTTFELDFLFKSGLGFLDGNSIEERSVTIQVQYRNVLVPEDGWQTVEYTYTDATMDQIGFTERINLPGPTLPEVQVRRVGVREPTTEIIDTVEWCGLRSMLPTAGSYPNWTTLAIKVKSGGKLGSSSENKINLIATRLLPQLNPDNNWTEPQATQQISAAFRYILTSVGYTDADIDMDELQRLHGIWYSRGDTFNHVFDETTVKEALDAVLAAGFAETTIDQGLVRPVRDEPRSTFEQAYSAQNIIGDITSTFSGKRLDDPDGVQVQYVDDESWTSTTVDCVLPGDAGINLEKLEIKGAFNKTRAWRIGMRRCRALRYRNWQHQFKTELDALNSRYLSYCSLSLDEPGFGQSAILVSVSSYNGQALLRSSEPLVWESGTDHVVAYRRPDGTLAGPFVANAGPDEFSVIADIPQPWPDITLNMEPPHLYFGTVTNWALPVLMQSIDADDDALTASATAVNYDERVYADDDNAPD